MLENSVYNRVRKRHVLLVLLVATTVTMYILYINIDTTMHTTLVAANRINTTYSKSHVSNISNKKLATTTRAVVLQARTDHRFPDTFNHVENVISIVTRNNTDFRDSQNVLGITVNDSTSEAHIVDLYDPFPADIGHDWPEDDSEALPIYILSAIGVNDTDVHGYERAVMLTGWVTSPHHKKTPIKCCILREDNIIQEEYHVPKVGHRRFHLVAMQITCPFNMSMSVVKGVALQFAETTCPAVNNTQYIRPYLPQQANTNHSFAVCLKIVFSKHVDNALFIQWIEFYREMKVDKIFMYTYGLAETTLQVIRHYTELGFVESRPFDYPNKSNRHVGQKTGTVWEDERVVMFDCLRRAAGYKYMAVVDMDEFLLPRKHENLKDLMSYLMTEYPLAGGFTFQSYLFVKNKVTSHTARNLSTLVKYTQRIPAMSGKGKGRVKNLVLPARVQVRGYDTHTFKPHPGYTRQYVPSFVAALNHYRSCYRNLRYLCAKNITTDTHMLQYYEKFKNRLWNPTG